MSVVESVHLTSNPSNPIPNTTTRKTKFKKKSAGYEASAAMAAAFSSASSSVSISDFIPKDNSGFGYIYSEFAYIHFNNFGLNI